MYRLRASTRTHNGVRVAIGVGGEQCLQKFFDIIDADGSGALSLEEIRRR